MSGMPDATGRPPSRACGPAPYQQPHPPLVRACIGEDSLVEMAKIGRPVLLGVQTLETLRHRLQRYRETMLEEGFAVAAVEQALEATWAQRGLYVADSDDEALEVAAVALSRYRHHLDEARRLYNPGGLPPRQPGAPSRRRRSSNTPSWPGRRSGSQSRSPPSSTRESVTCC